MSKLLNWIIQNKDWVFSGIGITSFSATFKLLHSKIKSWKDLASVRGEIESPTPGSVVQRTIKCNGRVIGLKRNQYLYLFIEKDKNTRFWAKEGCIQLENDNSWSARVFEDGSTGEFSLALYVCNKEANNRIHKWLKNGRKKGYYPPFIDLSGTQRIDRVDNLSINQDSNLELPT